MGRGRAERSRGRPPPLPLPPPQSKANTTYTPVAPLLQEMLYEHPLFAQMISVRDQQGRLLGCREAFGEKVKVAEAGDVKLQLLVRARARRLRDGCATGALTRVR